MYQLCGACSVLQRRVVIPFSRRLISSTPRLSSENESSDKHPLRRSFNILGKDLRFLRNLIPSKSEPETKNKETSAEKESLDTDANIFVPPKVFQTHCDVLVIGGGGVGSSIAYWLKKKARDGLNVVVVEKGSTYRNATVVQPMHGLSQQFSVPENIQMALYGSDFLRDAGDHLGDVNLKYMPYGSLTLASEENAEILKRNAKVQSELGVRNEILSPEKLKQKFPWLNTDDIVFGHHSLEREGWFDPLALLMGYKNKANEYGAHFVEAEVIDFEFQMQSNVVIEGQEQGEPFQALDKAVIRTPEGEEKTIKFALCVIAAGSQSANVGRLARIGTGNELLSIPLPVERRNKYAFLLNSENKSVPYFSTPMVRDVNGVFFRRHGLTGDYLCGREDNASRENVEMEKGEAYFDAEIRPSLEHRVEAFKSVKVQSVWTDTCEYNNFDNNGIVGTHPYYNNLYLAFGFNEHGIQQTPAVGRGISELIIDGCYRTIDLTRLGFDRIIVNQPIYDTARV